VGYYPSRASPPVGPHSLRLLLVRHGETVWNREGRYQGVIDVPLSPEGERQAAALAVQLRSEPLAAVYSSTLRRAYYTAVPIAAAHGLTVIRDPRLNEINQGQWEGLRPAEIVYVSCDPTTLARDLKVLGARYRVSELHMMDLFPQTYHLETVMVLRREDVAG